MAAGRGERIVAALDVGTSKVSALVALIAPDTRPRVLGVGHHLSNGLTQGVIKQLTPAEHAIRAAIDHAEKTSGERIEYVVLGVSSGSLMSDLASVEIEVGGQQIERADIDRLLLEARNAIEPGDRAILHAQPALYTLDGTPGFSNPLGFHAHGLGVDVHVVTADEAPIRNLDLCVRKAHLGVKQIVASPLASGLACLDPEERELGVALIEIGAGVTNISVFAQGMMVGCATLLSGGADITFAIAQTLMTPVPHAERMKTLYGTVTPSTADNHDMLDVVPVGQRLDDGVEIGRVSRAELAGIIRSRLSALFHEIAGQLEALGFKGTSARHVVLTGGTAQLHGIDYFARQILGKSVRIGRPTGLTGLPDAAAGPAFSTLAGLVHYAADPPEDVMRYRRVQEADFIRSPMVKLLRWFGATW